LLDLEPTGSVVVLGDEVSGLCQSLADRGWADIAQPDWRRLSELPDKQSALFVTAGLLDQVEDATDLSREVCRALRPGGLYISLDTPTIGAATIESPELLARKEHSPGTRRCPTIKHLLLEITSAGLTATAAYSSLEDTLPAGELRAQAREAGAIWPGLSPALLYRYFALRRQALGSSRRMIKIIPSSGLPRDVLFWLDTTAEIWAVKGEPAPAHE
jgi:hypothetical protein